MPRRREGAQRKQSMGISLDPAEAEVLAEVGDGSLSAGVSWLIRTVITEHPDGPLKRIAEMRVARQRVLEEEAQAKANARAEVERQKAAKKAAKGPTKAEIAFQENVDHYMAINAKRFAEGQPLYNMSHMSMRRELVAAVYAAARAKYGWETGPRPAHLGGAVAAPVGGSGGPASIQTIDSPQGGGRDADIPVLPEKEDAAEPQITQDLDLGNHDFPASVDASSSATVAHDPVDAIDQDSPDYAPHDPNGLLPGEVDDLQKSDTPDVQEPEF